MCLILFAFDDSADPGLVVAANRDEFFARATHTADYWEDTPHVLGGRDDVSQGTWLGVTRNGRFAAVTNVREPDVVIKQPLSRGPLTRDFLQGKQSPEQYLESLLPIQARYSGFNLLVGEFNDSRRCLYYLGNRGDGIVKLESGIYGLSNHLLDTDWPKVRRGKQWLQQTLTARTSIAPTSRDMHQLHARLRTYLEDGEYAADGQLPATGVSYAREKALSPAFIDLPDYGTRASTVLTLDSERITFSEQNYFTDRASNLGMEQHGDYRYFDIERDDREKQLSA